VQGHQRQYRIPVCCSVGRFAVVAVVAALAPSAMAQVCTGTNVVTAPSSLQNTVPGAGAQTLAAVRYTFGNPPSSDCDADSGNGGIEQSVTQVIIRPSCNLSGGACINDPGGDDADATTPAVEFLSLDATSCTGGLANITLDTSDPFAVTLNFTNALIFPPDTSCSVDVTLHVRERGNATTPNTVAQTYLTNGVCLCDPELNSAGVVSSQLTCPPGSTSFCALEVCNPTIVEVTALSSLQDRVPGAGPQAVAAVRYTFGSPQSSDCGDSSGASRSVTQVIIRPSCNLSGGACINDPGGDDADATTPAVEFLSLDATSCTGGLANITLDTSDPFVVALNFTNALIFPPDTSCSVDVTLHVRERGNATTQNTIAQTYSANGVCLCDPELNSPGAASSQLFLTCPSCSTNFCAPEVCNPTTLACDAQPPPDCSNPDNDLCTPGSCDEDLNACVNGPPQDPSLCDDDNVCTDDACVPATGNCSNTAKPPGFCDDGDPCTEDVCDPQDGCVHTPADPPAPECAEAICRAPGFWATHAGSEKSPGNGQPAVNITGAVIDCADGNCANHTASDFLLICGERIDSPDTDPADGTTDSDDAASSTEAMCVDVRGDSRLQLARQLTAAALNCLISGGGADCAGTGIYTEVFGDCNATCADVTSSKAEVTACISQLDCLNKGGSFQNGLCGPGGPNNCQQRILVNEDLGLDFDPPGSAGSSDACQAAKRTRCAVVGPREAKCDFDSLP